MKPPHGEPWVWLTLEFLRSPALRSCSIYARRLLDFVQAEHCLHGGQENGQLMATYTQLKEYGISKKSIRPTIHELGQFGFLEVPFRGYRDRPSTYRLCHLPTPNTRPTNEWQKVSVAEAEAISEAANQSADIRARPDQIEE
jgi:hypothetical protein